VGAACLDSFARISSGAAPYMKTSSTAEAPSGRGPECSLSVRRSRNHGSPIGCRGPSQKSDPVPLPGCDRQWNAPDSIQLVLFRRRGVATFSSRSAAACAVGAGDAVARATSGKCGAVIDRCWRSDYSLVDTALRLISVTSGACQPSVGWPTTLARRVPPLSRGPLNAQKPSEPLMILEPQINL
jgi:hypothetical protein